MSKADEQSKAAGPRIGPKMGPKPVRGPQRRGTEPVERVEAPKRPASAVGAQLAAEVARLERELSTARAQLAELTVFAQIDPLTDILNRRGLERELKRSLAHVKRYGASAALVYLDLDGFKRVNDRHGHAAGDTALRALADRLRERLRIEDVAGRFGGEEFVIGLPDADAEGAAAVAEAVRAAVAARPLTVAGRELTLTVSVGWATWEDDDLGQLLARADGALYEAKAAGRDCVRPHADSPT